ncbi:Uncharacterised protein [Vibrio cholerae]|nr:Uncharacterised protein [Vibrio cholerae]
MVSIEDLFCFREIFFHLAALSPRNIDHPIDVATHYRCFC